MKIHFDLVEGPGPANLIANIRITFVSGQRGVTARVLGDLELRGIAMWRDQRTPGTVNITLPGTQGRTGRYDFLRGRAGLERFEAGHAIQRFNRHVYEEFVRRHPEHPDTPAVQATIDNMPESSLIPPPRAFKRAEETPEGPEQATATEKKLEQPTEKKTPGKVTAQAAEKAPGKPGAPARTAKPAPGDKDRLDLEKAVLDAAKGVQTIAAPTSRPARER